ncbi:conjugal transfer protein TraR [Alkalimonas sp. MEB108]|uniref:Conjugal transfer protein TraR n=1 Tax=Alkalimonas cellulosilytica TaxID=3058395 RepID=A0ABU7J579_9GAMM|nr:conjugal transfer protein TraR [Alkalimonas sp. MEB108]MEE2001663.1 conjugal transfer protein TraR [Alkalimonas sp. MEB108]
MSIRLNQLRTRLLEEQQQLQQQIASFLAAQPSQDYQQLHLKLEQLPLPRWPELLLHWHTPELRGPSKRLEAVQAALSQMEIGLYGICCDCESRIEVERLELDPAEQRCAKCSLGVG